MQKSVAIIGGGPSGLVAAKTLLQHAGGVKFKVTVYEAAERVGGMWRSLPGDSGVKCSTEMRTNLSRFTVSFSDLAWTSVNLSDPASDSKPPATPPMFPKAWQVGRYLDAYAKKFLPDVIQLNRRVVAADLLKTNGMWSVTSTDTSTQHQSTETFDYLVVASGFFDRPTPSLSQSQSISPEARARIQHSSEFRDVSSLVDVSGKIVVIGGSISGSEAAATAAFQISSAKYSPAKGNTAYSESTVYHIFNRPFYCLPRYLPQDPYNPAIQRHNLSPQFLPLDLNLYNLGRRGEGLITASNGLMPPEKAKKAHEFIRSLIGGDQRDTGREELVYRPDATQFPAYMGISDTYNEFVRSGLIVPVAGRVESVVHQHTHKSSADRFSIETVSLGPFAKQEGLRNTLEDVAGIIEATGYQVHLEYLANDIKQALDYDSECYRVPFLLSSGSIFSPKVPNMAFVGFYEGPFWEVMEMQARLVAQTWDPTLSAENGSVSDVSVAQSKQVRDAIKARAPNVPQFWMGDYVGLVDEFARLTNTPRSDYAFNGQKGPGFPARYCANEADSEAIGMIAEVADVLQKSEGGARFVAAAAFRGMQGRWTLHRKLDSRNASMPGGTFAGTANFHPRLPTSPLYFAEYLYVESGTLTMDNGLTFPAARRYIYRYNEATDTITAWFAEEDGVTTGTLFNTWEFYAPTDENGVLDTEKGWMARGHHWCSPDTYRNKCEFRFRGASLERFGITYEVEGPKKDYLHESWYSR